jgi:integrase
MATARFNLKDPKAKSETLIYLMFSYSGHRLKYSTGQKVNPKDWSDNKQAVRGTLAGSSAINSYLETLAAKANANYLNCISNGETPSTDHLRELLNKDIDRVDAGSKRNLFAAFDEFVKIQTSQKAANTIKKYNSIRNLLHEFETVDGKRITFENINAAFYERLIDFFFSEKNYLNNTAGKYIAGLKTFLNWATDREYNTNLAYKKFKGIQEEADIIYLTQDELDTVYNLDLTNNKRLDQVRDLFCLSCATGLRYSDLVRLSPQHIKNGEIRIKVKKTHKDIVIPLNYISIAIIEKYENQLTFLPKVSNQKGNDYLKELCKLAGIDDLITLTQYNGANPIEVTKPKHELISFHDGRRTFIVLSLEKGMRAEVVMEITGHKDYKTFKKYIKIVANVIRGEMKTAWANPTPLRKLA